MRWGSTSHPRSASGQREEGFHRVRGGEDDPLVKSQLGSGALQRPRIERRDDFEKGEKLDLEAGGLEGGGQGFGLVLGPGDGDPAPHPLAPSPIALPPDRERGNACRS